jgi:hypothetical protein
VARLFTAVSADLLASWMAAVDADGVLTVGPAERRRAGFWEDCFDGEARAVQDFNDAVESMLAS